LAGRCHDGSERLRILSDAAMKPFVAQSDNSRGRL
jgi:hypothetical protein